MLVNDESARFMQQLIRELQAQGGDRDVVLWRNVAALEHYFDKAGY